MKAIKLSSRDALIKAAFQVYAEHPGASLSDVAARAGVGRATLHRHFAGREALMIALAEAALVEIDDAVEAATKDAKSYGEALRLTLAAVIPLANRQWFLAHEPVEQAPEIAKATAKQSAELRMLIDQAKAEGLFAQDAPTVWIAATFDNLVYAAWSLIRAEEATPAQAAALAWRTLTVGLSKERS